MKSTFAFLTLFLSTYLCALEAPKPIRGTPNILAGKRFSMSAGKSSYVFTFPEGWGLGETSSAEKASHFTLFPKDGGYGCSLQVDRYDNETLAREEAERIRRTFSNVQDFSNGFESVSGKNRFACRLSGLFVVQIWYCVPKSSSQDDVIWQKLKDSLTVSVIEEQKQEAAAVLETSWKPVQPYGDTFRDGGWMCNHPNNQLHVVIKDDFLFKSKPNDNPRNKYLLAISDRISSGFFYVKWDQAGLETNSPYQDHIREIKADIMLLEKNQKWENEKEIVFNLKEGWAFLKGSPYCAFSLSGDGFLFGFALKNKAWHSAFEINDYNKRVAWFKTEH